MIARVIADLESVLVQFPDLCPGHVVLLVRAKGKPLGDEERGSEAVTLQDGPHDRVVRRHGVIERQYHQPVRHRLERLRW